MILRDNRDIKSDSSQEETSTSGAEEYSIAEVSYEDNYQSQRENIFHSKCMIHGKCCSLIIDGGTNLLSEQGEIVVDKQVTVDLTLGKNKDEIFCDVVPMEAITP
ncbi:hypothetical protein CR513_53517, partial [Mucuna pruriens]